MGKAIGVDVAEVDDLKYQKRVEPTKGGASEEITTVKLRYKKPDGDKSKLLEIPITDDGKPFQKASPDYRFAASVAAFGILLRDTPSTPNTPFVRGDLAFADVLETAGRARGEDKLGYRGEFLDLVRTAGDLS